MADEAVTQCIGFSPLAGAGGDQRTPRQPISHSAPVRLGFTMKTIVAPVAELLAQLHDNAAGVAKLIEAIPALKGDDLPQIVNRVHMLGKLKELEAEFPAGKVPSDEYLRNRVRLLQAHRQAQDNDRLDYEFRGMSNKALATRVELLRKIIADQLDDWTDVEIDNAVAELQGERRRRKRDAKAAADAATAFFEPDVDDVTARSTTHRNGGLSIVG
jgi:hypothetical protein